MLVCSQTSQMFVWSFLIGSRESLTNETDRKVDAMAVESGGVFVVIVASCAANVVVPSKKGRAGV